MCRYWLIIAATVFSVQSAGTTSTRPSNASGLSRFAALVAEAKPRVREIGAGEVKALLQRKDQFLLIDVREDGEWRQGHIPGAVHLSKGVIERDIENLAPEAAARIVLYCGVGSRSILAADSLQRMGYTNVSTLQGGFRAWIGSQHER